TYPILLRSSIMRLIDPSLERCFLTGQVQKMMDKITISFMRLVLRTNGLVAPLINQYPFLAKSIALIHSTSYFANQNQSNKIKERRVGECEIFPSTKGMTKNKGTIMNVWKAKKNAPIESLT
ncbi:MAG: hypothetical protein ACM3VS_02035, partial [Candidatus Dadabacteria bacterium]